MVCFDVNYYSPDGRVGDWNTDQFAYPLIEEIDDDQVVQNVKGQKYLQPVLADTQSLREL